MKIGYHTCGTSDSGEPRVLRFRNQERQFQSLITPFRFGPWALVLVYDSCSSLQARVFLLESLDVKLFEQAFLSLRRASIIIMNDNPNIFGGRSKQLIP